MPDHASVPARYDRALAGDVLEIGGPAGPATVALLGAHVLSWQPAGHAPVLWLSPVTRLDTGAAIRGGIPVCWPWFAQHPGDASMPSHGFVRTRPWRQTTASAAGRVRLETETMPADARLWPHSAHVALEVGAGTTLTVALTTRNTGRAPFALTEALHTYFAVGDVGTIAIGGFDGLDYLDKLDGFARKRQAGAIRFTGEVDRIYLGHSGRATIDDEGLGRRIAIDKSGSASSVVWNPWTDKSARLGDIDRPGETGGFRRMVCVETTNAGDDIVTLAPGGTHTLEARISLERR